jgi:hypothetical protein
MSNGIPDSSQLSRLVTNICGSNQDASVQIVAILQFRSINVFSDARRKAIGPPMADPFAWKMAA